jgi:serine/threonine protein phosphatase PrpC
MLADAGAIEADGIAHHPFRNILGSLLCCEPGQLTPCVYQRRLAPGDQLLLCTDGLTKHVSAPQIAEILNSTYSAEDACGELIDAANAAGGTDNTTVVLARFGHREAETVEDPAISVEARQRSSSPGQWLLGVNRKAGGDEPRLKQATNLNRATSEVASVVRFF